MTLIDGEMIIDTVPESGLKRRYLAYDLMALDAVSKTKVNNVWISYIKFCYFWLSFIYQTMVSFKVKKRDDYPAWIISWKLPAVHRPCFALIFTIIICA